MELELHLRNILMKISNEKKNEEEYANADLRKIECDATAGEKLCRGIEADDIVFVDRCYEKFEHVKLFDGSPSAECGLDEHGLLNSSVVKEDDINRKRKRCSYVDLLRWISDVAKDPCLPIIGSLPEMSKWKCYSNDVIWKQVLLLRDEMLLKKSSDTSAQCSIWQKKQKMHPSMYEDNAAPERLRSSQRVLFLKKVRFPASSPSRIPVGPQFQADIPEWREEKVESDSKWLGIRIWPLDKREQNRRLIERDPIGKGRQDTCGCQYPASFDCVKFHLTEKRKKVKLELGSAFHWWRFGSMGEEVALSWTKQEEKKFEDIAGLNPLSSVNKTFWKEIFKLFEHKTRESLVSYYFNVFLLRRRGHQNRTSAGQVDSDDDEA